MQEIGFGGLSEFVLDACALKDTVRGMFDFAVSRDGKRDSSNRAFPLFVLATV